MLVHLILMPDSQGIIRDSPKFDSSFDRGRPMRVFFKKAQLSLGLEEAVADMKPGGVKMVFLIPELSLACPQVCCQAFSKLCCPCSDAITRIRFPLSGTSPNYADCRLCRQGYVWLTSSRMSAWHFIWSWCPSIPRTQYPPGPHHQGSDHPWQNEKGSLEVVL